MFFLSRSPPRRQCKGMCQTAADASCKRIHQTFVKELFSIARSDEDTTSSLGFVFSLAVTREGCRHEAFCLVAAYFEPKTAGIAQGSLIALELAPRHLQASHFRCRLLADFPFQRFWFPRFLRLAARIYDWGFVQGGCIFGADLVFRRRCWVPPAKGNEFSTGLQV